MYTLCASINTFKHFLEMKLVITTNLYWIFQNHWDNTNLNDVVDKMLSKPRIDVDINSDHPARQLRPWSSWKEMNERSWGGMSKSHHNISWLDDKIVNVSNIKYNKIKYKSINYKSLSSNRYESFIESPTIDFL